MNTPEKPPLIAGLERLNADINRARALVADLQRLTVTTPFNVAWVWVWCALVVLIHLMIWVGCAGYGPLRVPLFVSIIGAEVIGALLLVLLTQGWKQ